MKRILSCALLLFVLTMGLFAAPENATDVVVLLDTSTSVIPYFDIITDNILCGITQNYVKTGDTFHLISFGSTYKLETALTVQTRADIESIVARFMLLYPLDTHTDFLSALQYTQQYVSALRLESQKSVVIITDGIQDPAPESTVFDYSPEKVKQEMQKTAERMKAAGWNIYYIRLPLPAGAAILSDKTTTSESSVDGTSSGTSANGSEDAYNLSNEFSEGSGITPIPIENAGDSPETSTQNIFNLPIIECDSDFGRQNRSFTIPLRITNPSSKKVYLELNQVQVDGNNILKSNGFLVLDPQASDTLKAKVRLPDEYTEGPQTVSVHLEFAGNQRTNPQNLSFSIDVKNSIFDGFVVIVPVLSIVLAVILILALLLFGIKKLSEKTGTSRSRTAKALKPEYNESDATYKDSEQSIASGRSATASYQGNAATYNLNSVHENTMVNSSISNDGNNNGQKIQYSPADTSSYRKETISYEKPTYDIPSTSYAKSDYLYDQDAISQAAANQQGVFTYTLKKDAQAEQAAKTKRVALFAAADPYARIDVKNTKNTMLELYVYNQSRMIGKRNIHIVKPGKRYSIGGGKSNFLVFLVKFPQKIAELRYDGEMCSLAIFKPEYFPNETSAIIENCINHDFCIVSDRGYPVTFRIREYEDPVEKYNRLVQSIKYD